MTIEEARHCVAGLPIAQLERIIATTVSTTLYQAACSELRARDVMLPA